MLATNVVNDKSGVGQTKRESQAATPIYTGIIPIVVAFARARAPIAGHVTRHEPPTSLS